VVCLLDVSELATLVVQLESAAMRQHGQNGLFHCPSVVDSLTQTLVRLAIISAEGDDTAIISQRCIRLFADITIVWPSVRPRFRVLMPSSNNNTQGSTGH
jgi:hypothetical protein